uniref:Uncharacterized protein n=1 Tax=Amorphochlora amoebiformis TaxID=1561963 RepID=A0A7S0DTA9_9EUKA|mmetsp:Transcript_9340/g.14743  ORF Transcript_9340/g.14743 Transcript_9340/m.14743 type:complete len:469 (+) Transcript_9340:22-1428(+)
MADEVIVGERHSYYIIQVKEEGETLYEAITEAGLDYVKGHGYYQLGNKRENVNASKQLVWYDGEECVDDPSAVRERLGLGEGKIRVSQRDLEEGSLFIQSTSANRGLRKKTACLFIASSAVATKAVKSGKKSAKKAKRKPSKSKGKKMEEEGKEEDTDEDESKGQVDVIKGSKHSYYLVQVEDDKVTLEDAISTAGLQYSRGSGYYQLGRKKEAISAKKDMVWYDGDEVIDVSKDIRQKFGMGMGKIKINHNDIDEGSLFVQSTSANRGLIRGSACLLLDDNALAPSKAKSKGKKRVAGKSNATIGGPKAKKQRTKLQTSKAPKKSSNGKGKSSIGPILSIGETKKVTRGVPGTFPFGLEWEDCGDLFYSLDSNKIQPSEKVVAFDMDGTLIEPKSGSKFARNRTDWRWLFDNVPTKLKGLYNAGYKIVIFTNQAGIEKSRTNASDIQGTPTSLYFCVASSLSRLIAP